MSVYWLPDATLGYSSSSVWLRDDDEPTLGVREPRVPLLPTLSGGAAAVLHYAAEAEAEARPQGASVTEA